MRHLVLLPLALAACTVADDATDDTAVDDGPTSRVALATHVFFAGVDDGVSLGFDLDRSGDDAGAGCGITDLVDEDGDIGIDNAFGAGLLPVITDPAIGGQALPELVQNAVTDGELLIMVEMDGYDDAAPGDCLDTQILRGLGKPVTGGTGQILANQTFDQHPAFPASDVLCGEVQDDGSVKAAGFDFRLPLAVFDEFIDLTLRDATVQLRETSPGVWDGVIGGGVLTAEIAANVQGFDAVPSVLVNSVVSFLDLWADLAPEGNTCTQISVVVGFEGVDAFLYDGEPPALPADTADTGDSGI